MKALINKIKTVTPVEIAMIVLGAVIAAAVLLFIYNASTQGIHSYAAL